jgi:serine/threonine protein phosphatase PrpC
MHHATFDDALSGTTAITGLLRGSTLFVGNVGDSRSIVGTLENGKVVGKALSFDQTPFRQVRTLSFFFFLWSNLLAYLFHSLG